jgi:uncharacterized protein YegP (UPF0339 family)
VTDGKQSEAPRFVLVCTPDGWHVRLVGGNGEIVAQTETYTERETAEDAVLLIARAGIRMVHEASADDDWEPEVLDLCDPQE